MTRGQPTRDALDAIDEAVARISDAEVDRHLAKVLRQGGFHGSSVPFTEAPLRLKGSPGGHRPARLTRLGGWAAPLAAAAAVVLVVSGAAAGSWLVRSLSSHPGDSGAPGQGTPAVSFTGAPADPYAGVPAYYVEIANPSLAVVRATATGVTLARIATRTPFVGVTGGADDRTFVLDAQRSIMGPAVRWPGRPAFYLLRLSSSGAEESFTQLNIAAPPDGAAVAGMALSPDSSKLAVALDTGTPGAPGLLEIRVYTLATGAFRTWSAHGLADSQAPEGFTGSGVDASESISWAADSRTLAFDVMNQNFTRGVRLLDTAASGGDLIADSRLAVTERDQGGREALTSKDHVSQCVTNSIISARRARRAGRQADARRNPRWRNQRREVHTVARHHTPGSRCLVIVAARWLPCRAPRRHAAQRLTAHGFRPLQAACGITFVIAAAGGLSAHRGGREECARQRRKA